MALQGFEIQSPSTVIQDDDRDPDVSWAHHESRYPGQTNRGGVDVVAAVGTPVHAWADGTVHNVANDGSAGNVIRLALTHDPGWYLDYKHLSAFALRNGTQVARGTLIGYSGKSGGVVQHLHLNLVDPRGIRRNPWHYTDSGSASAGQPSPVQEDDMFSDADRDVLNQSRAAIESSRPVAKLYRDNDPKSKTFGWINAIEPYSGLDYHLTNTGEIQLLLRFGIVANTKWTDLPSTEFNLLRNVAASARRP